MDEPIFIFIITSGSISSLCLFCILIKAFNSFMDDRRQERLKSIAKKMQDRLRYNSINPEEENLRQMEVV
jgi:hypothetical protein